jgi:acetyltransferase
MNIRLVESKEKEIKNPYDIIGTALSKDYLNALEKIKDWGTDFISVILTPQSMSEIEKTAEAIADFKKKTGKKVVAFFLGDKSILKANKIFEEAGILVFNTI